MSEKLKEVKQQENFEVIACVFDPKKQEWRCLSAVEFPWEKGKYEILEMSGKKFQNEYELVKSLVKSGKSKWFLRS